MEMVLMTACAPHGIYLTYIPCKDNQHHPDGLPLDISRKPGFCLALNNAVLSEDRTARAKQELPSFDSGSNLNARVRDRSPHLFGQLASQRIFLRCQDPKRTCDDLLSLFESRRLGE